MALFQVNCFSNALRRPVPFNVILPNDVPEYARVGNAHYDRPTKSFYLYHGYSGNCFDWLTGSQVQELAGKYNLAIILPSGDNSFYLNSKGTGRAYETFVGVELVDYITRTFHLSSKKEDIFVGGLSMGGFGAIHTGLRFPDVFGKVVGLSSALIINTLDELKPGESNDFADYDYYVNTFGDFSQLATSVNNPEFLVKDFNGEKAELPAIYLACGTEDFGIENNRDFHQFLLDQGVRVTYHESPGYHDWAFWNEYLEPSIQWLLEVEQ